jgi:hypothetical protein
MLNMIEAEKGGYLRITDREEAQMTDVKRINDAI